MAADFLSRPLLKDKGEGDNKQVVVLPEALFVDSHYEIPDKHRGLARTPPVEPSPRHLKPPSQIRVFDLDSIHQDLEDNIRWSQKQHPLLMEEWKEAFHCTQEEHSHHVPKWTQSGKLVVPPDLELKRRIMTHTHDAPTAGHPGRDETLRQVKRDFWWPGMTAWITDYVEGCGECQQNKIRTHRLRVPIYKIDTPSDAKPFERIAMDLITGLPKSHGYDAILTIVDHGCSRAATFVPCSTTVTGPEIAQMYLDNVYRWFGLPKKVITDRDPRFTSHFGRALTAKLGVQQNLSTAFHPQTDGLAE
jgi:Integrase zinc binding domain